MPSKYTYGDSRGVSAIADATNAWNSVCGQYRFIPKPLDSRLTFAQGYFGYNFTADMQAITNHVNYILSIEQPSGGNDVMSIEQPSGGNDVMKFSIESWDY